ncbi:MAG: Fe-S cluster assembly ATPase SufC [Rickettsiales bacterium]|nr:Fe-S cluster assembly ATPase SufC [Rickettsiales bacterium]
MLKIENLHVAAEGREILSGLGLGVKAGETHVIMGKNGGGKSTLLSAIAKNPKYEITAGSIAFDGVDLAGKSADEVARMGVFLSFQNAPAIPGLTISTLLKHAANSVRRARGEEPLSAPKFFKLADEYSKLLEIPPAWMNREANVGFSGGERKKIACLEMLFLNPRLALLDEPDSGVDVDAMNIIVRAIERLRSSGTAFVVVSHYSRLIDRLAPDAVYVMREGAIAASGGAELAGRIEEHGFADI